MEKVKLLHKIHKELTELISSYRLRGTALYYLGGLVETFNDIDVTISPDDIEALVMYLRRSGFNLVLVSRKRIVAKRKGVVVDVFLFRQSIEFTKNKVKLSNIKNKQKIINFLNNDYKNYERYRA